MYKKQIKGCAGKNNKLLRQNKMKTTKNIANVVGQLLGRVAIMYDNFTNQDHMQYIREEDCALKYALHACRNRNDQLDNANYNPLTGCYEF
jgi:hypothetical protein